MGHPEHVCGLWVCNPKATFKVEDEWCGTKDCSPLSSLGMQYSLLGANAFPSFVIFVRFFEGGASQPHCL